MPNFNPQEEARLKKIFNQYKQEVSPLGIKERQAQLKKAQEAIAQVEEMGFGTVWVPEAVLREPFASTSLS